MGRPARYDQNVQTTVRQMKAVFGTPRTAYDNLRAEAVGIPFRVWSYLWSNERADLPTRNAIQMLWPAYWDELIATSLKDLPSFRLSTPIVKQAQYWLTRPEEKEE